MKCTMVRASLVLLVLSVFADRCRAASVEQAAFASKGPSSAAAIPPLATITSFYPFSQLVGRQSSEPASVATQLLAALFGLAATGRVAPILMPILVKFLVIPLMAVVRALAKKMMLFGVIAYLVSGSVPPFLNYLGPVVGRAGFAGRAVQSGADWIVAPISNLNGRVAALTDGTLNYLNMNTGQCRQMLSCKVGRFMVDEYPGFTGYLKKFGIDSYLESSAGSNYTSVLLDAMSGTDNCTQQQYPCPNFVPFEGYLNLATDVNGLMELTTPKSMPSSTTTTSSPTTTEATTESNSEASRNLFNALNALASNYDFSSRFSNLTSYLY